MHKSKEYILNHIYTQEHMNTFIPKILIITGFIFKKISGSKSSICCFSINCTNNALVICNHALTPGRGRGIAVEMNGALTNILP